MAENKERKDEKKQEECKEGAPEYMATYGDMMTLLLCFFVLLLSMAEVDPAKFDIAASSFQNALSGVLESMPTVAIHQEVLRPRLGGDDQNRRMAAQAAMRIREAMKKDFKEDAVKVEVTETGIGIRVNDPVTFATGRADLKNEFEEILQEVLKVIDDVVYESIRVEGHTDNIPINTDEYPSNWELSSARALQVVQFLHRRGVDPAKLSAVGYGEYRPLVPNTTGENRRKNRRIEIFVDFEETQRN
ncbi:MAG: OmpA family protein [Fibrobacterota bacterium]